MALAPEVPAIWAWYRSNMGSAADSKTLRSRHHFTGPGEMEIMMNTKSQFQAGKALLCVATAATCAMLYRPIQASEHVVTVTILVDVAGLDAHDPGYANELYRRLRIAARIACSDGNRVDLKPQSNFPACYENALGDAVHSINMPPLNALYLETHTLRDAAAHGIEVPQRVAADQSRTR
jgi:UrcA family protein